MRAASSGLESARASRAGFDVAPKQSFVCIPAALNRSESKEKFAIGSTRDACAPQILQFKSLTLQRFNPSTI